MSGFALGNKATGEVAQVWATAPRKISIPGENVDIHSPLPGKTYGDWKYGEITDKAQPSAFVSSAHILAGTVVFTNGRFWREWALEDVPVADIRHQAVAAISAAAEQRRIELSDPRAAKRDTYLMKAEIAERALAGDAAALTMLSGEAASRGKTGVQLRDIILGKRTAWEHFAMAIAEHEAAGTGAIATAADGPGAVAARDAAIAAIDAVGA